MNLKNKLIKYTITGAVRSKMKSDGTKLLEKAILQNTLIEDTVEVQFCSNWLKDQITDLFKEIEKLKKENDFLKKESEVLNNRIEQLMSEFYDL